MLCRKLFCLLFLFTFSTVFHKATIPCRFFLFTCFVLSQILMCVTYYYYFENLYHQILHERKYIFSFCIRDHKKSVHHFRKSDEKLCTICFEACDEDSVCELNCPCHEKFYHVDCIKTWIIKNPSCPICREKVSI